MVLADITQPGEAAGMDLVRHRRGMASSLPADGLLILCDYGAGQPDASTSTSARTSSTATTVELRGGSWRDDPGAGQRMRGGAVLRRRRYLNMRSYHGRTGVRMPGARPRRELVAGVAGRRPDRSQFVRPACASRMIGALSPNPASTRREDTARRERRPLPDMVGREAGRTMVLLGVLRPGAFTG
jgi:hypothetical protein